jgi:hypothetical protein
MAAAAARRSQTERPATSDLRAEIVENMSFTSLFPWKPCASCCYFAGIRKLARSGSLALQGYCSGYSFLAIR